MQSLALDQKMLDAFDPCLNAVTADPDSSVAHYFLGFAYLERGEPEKGLSAFQTAKRIEPRSAKIHVGLGFAYLKLKQYQSALRQFDYAQSLDRKVDHALVGIGTTYAHYTSENTRRCNMALSCTCALSISFR